MTTKYYLPTIALVVVLFALVGCDNGNGGSPLTPVTPGTPVTPEKPDDPPPPDPEPVLTVSIDDTYGDRFKPAIIDVSYTLDGEPIEWTYETNLRAEKTPAGLEVYGDGDAYEGEVIINGGSYFVQLSAEPRCAKQEGERLDCQGYDYYGPVDGLVYYGEQDRQTVEWELIVLKYVRACEIPSPTVAGLCDDPTEGHTILEAIDRRIQQYNFAMLRSGVHVRFTLKEFRYVETSSLNAGAYLVDYLKGDIGIGLGASCAGTGGCAYMNNRYYKPGFGWSVQGWQTDLHEMGHSIGLGHGPENSSNPGTGSVFPTFGHGWMYNQCNNAGDLMSYNSYSNEFLNSLYTCNDVFEDGVETYVTDRSYADSAYHLNRVRYDVSVVNDEHNEGTAKALRFIVPSSKDEGMLIRD